MIACVQGNAPILQESTVKGAGHILQEFWRGGKKEKIARPRAKDVQHPLMALDSIIERQTRKSHDTGESEDSDQLIQLARQRKEKAPGPLLVE